MCKQCGSALFPATKHIFENSGQRIIQRIDKRWPVFFYTQLTQTSPHKGQSRNISLHGMQIETDTGLAVDRIIRLSSRYLAAVARVVNVCEDHRLLSRRYRLGLEFLTLRLYQAQGIFLKVDA